MTDAVASRSYAILTGGDAGYLIVERVDDAFVTQGYSIDGAFRPHSDGVHATLRDAQREAAARYGTDLHNWYPIPAEEDNPLVYATRHAQRAGAERPAVTGADPWDTGTIPEDFAFASVVCDDCNTELGHDERCQNVLPAAWMRNHFDPEAPLLLYQCRHGHEWEGPDGSSARDMSDQVRKEMPQRGPERYWRARKSDLSYHLTDGRAE